jgi:hypothetical protein
LKDVKNQVSKCVLTKNWVVEYKEEIWLFILEDNNIILNIQAIFGRSDLKNFENGVLKELKRKYSIERRIKN